MPDSQQPPARALAEATIDVRSRPSLRDEDRFRRLFDSNSVGIVICDTGGSITEANDAFLGMLGYERDDLPLRWDRMTPPEWLDLDRAKVEEGMTTGAGRAWEKEYLARDGHRVPVIVAFALLDATRGECVAIVHDISERKQLEVSLRHKKDSLRALTARLVLAEEHERRRIATGLHDEIGQTLALARLRLGQMTARGQANGATGQAEDVEALLDRAIAATRSLTFELGSPVLHELGFDAALESICEEMEQAHGIQVRYQAAQRPGLLAGNLAVLLYRIVRELLDNAATHARPRDVTVSVQATGAEIRIVVEDDGVGFDVKTAGEGFGPAGGFGLFSINEQLGHIGGRLELDSTPGRGTRAVVVAPLAPIGESEP